MTMTQPGTIAVVTGGGRRLGRAMAPGLSRTGFRVAITAARNRAELETVAREASPRGDVGSGWSKSARQHAGPTRHHATGRGSPPRAVDGGAERGGQALIARNQ